MQFVAVVVVDVVVAVVDVVVERPRKCCQDDLFNVDVFVAIAAFSLFWGGMGILSLFTVSTPQIILTVFAS